MSKLTVRRLLLSVLLISMPTGLSAQGNEGDGLKVYISADMEGLAAAVSGRQVGSSGSEYGTFRQILTQEVNAAIQGALAAGATDVMVGDSHGSGQNILPLELDTVASLVRGFPRPLDMMQGIDSTFDAVIFIGYHAAEGVPGGGTLAHTMAGSRILWLKVNGKEVSEGGFNAAVAGHFGVPVVFVSGDRVTTDNMRQLLGNLGTAVVKEPLGKGAAMTIHPELARRSIQSGVAEALSRLGDFQAHRVGKPVEIEVAFKEEGFAQLASMFPAVDLSGPRTVSATFPDMVEAARFVVGLMFLGSPD